MTGFGIRLEDAQLHLPGDAVLIEEASGIGLASNGSTIDAIRLVVRGTGGLPREVRLDSALEGFGALPVAWRLRSGAHDSIGDFSWEVLNFNWSLWQNVSASVLTAGKVPLATVQACRPIEHPSRPSSRIAPTTSGGRWTQPESFASGSIGGFINAEPGDVVLRLEAPTGKTLHCSTRLGTTAGNSARSLHPLRAR